MVSRVWLVVRWFLSIRVDGWISSTYVVLSMTRDRVQLLSRLVGLSPCARQFRVRRSQQPVPSSITDHATPNNACSSCTGHTFLTVWIKGETMGNQLHAPTGAVEPPHPRGYLPRDSQRYTSSTDPAKTCSTPSTGPAKTCSGWDTVKQCDWDAFWRSGDDCQVQSDSAFSILWTS